MQVLIKHTSLPSHINTLNTVITTTTMEQLISLVLSRSLKLSQPNSTSTWVGAWLGMQPYFDPSRWNMKKKKLGAIQKNTTSRQPRKLIFGIQPYFNPTRCNMQKQHQLGWHRIFQKNPSAIKTKTTKIANDNLTRNKTISTPTPK